MAMIIPNENDVLLGRGGRNFEHDGNEQLRRIARNWVQDYQRASKKQKAVISRQILHQIKSMEPEGRFLLKNYSTYKWDAVSDAVAREKVCQALRDAVAVKKDLLCSNDDCFKSVPSEPLPNALDTLSSESSYEIAVKEVAANQQPEKKDKKRRLEKETALSSNVFNSSLLPARYYLSRGIVTPVKTEAAEQELRFVSNIKQKEFSEDEHKPSEIVTPGRSNAEEEYDQVVTHHYPPVKAEGAEEELRFKSNIKQEEEITPEKPHPYFDHLGIHHYRSGLSDDFDLFDGGLLKETDDEVLKTFDCKG